MNELPRADDDDDDYIRSFAARWEATEPIIRRRVARFGLDRDAADEVVADTAERMLRRRVTAATDRAFVLAADSLAWRIAQERRRDLLRRARLGRRRDRTLLISMRSTGDETDEARNRVELRLAVQQELSGTAFAALPAPQRRAVMLFMRGGAFSSTERWVIHEARKGPSLRRWAEGLLGALVMLQSRLRTRSTDVQTLPGFVAAAMAATLALSVNSATATNEAPGVTEKRRAAAGLAVAARDLRALQSPPARRGPQRTASAAHTTTTASPGRESVSAAVSSRLPTPDQPGYVHIRVVQELSAPLGSETSAGVGIRCDSPTRRAVCELAPTEQ